MKSHTSEVCFHLSEIKHKGTGTDWKTQQDKMQTHKDVNGRSGDLPKTSTPNSSQDLYVDGKLWQRRFYDANGNMIKDIDFWHGNPDAHTFPHEHWWEWINGVPKRD